MRSCILTVDVEEWFQVENLKSAISCDNWETLKSSVALNIDHILELFLKHNVQATFFILGWVAERNPLMIKRIFDNGHEIASHGYGHKISGSLQNGLLREDIQKSKHILEDLTGIPITGYRAPNFSVNDEVIDIIKDLGFTYDSSYNPFQMHSRYGHFDRYTIRDSNIFNLGNGLFEIPIASYKFGRFHIPIGGGAYFRIFPYVLFKYLALAKGRRDGLYNFYTHPWEFEPDQPRINDISFNHRLRHYTGLKKTANRLEKLIAVFKQKDFKFITMQEYVKAEIKIRQAVSSSEQ